MCRTRVSASNSYAECANAGGELAVYTYDTLGRVTARGQAGNASPIAYTYDDAGAGQVMSVGNSRYSYIRALGLLSEVAISNGNTYAFTYADLNRLATSGESSFTYNAFGDLIGINDRSLTLQIAYAPEGYSVAEGNHRLGYRLDARGYLVGLLYDDAPLLEVDYLSQQTKLDVILNDDTLIEYNVDENRQTRNLALSGGNDMSIFYDVTATGLIRRQNIILPYADGGYVVIYGYDNDERPLTMRITDFQGLTVLFSQAIRYNEVGLRIGENWQYADGTQVIIRYSYGANSQLTERVVNISSATRGDSVSIHLYP